MTTATDLDIRTWTKGDGTTRRYINDWHAACGIEIDYYKSGNICWAAVDGETISNGRASSFLSAKIWLDSKGCLHIDRYNEDRLPLSEDEVRTRLIAALAEHGITAR